MKLPDTRTLGPAQLDQLRLRAIHAIVEEGLTQSQAAQALGVSRQSVNAWYKAYREGGASALRSRQRGRRPGHKKLQPWQAAQTARALRGSPRDHGFESGLWTREIIKAFVEQHFGVQLGLSTVSEYLTRWGFTRQKPVHRAIERNPTAVRTWLENEYPAIKTRARKEGATIFWGDEVGFDSREHSGRTYGLKGQTPVVEEVGKRFHCSAILAVNNEGEMRFMVYDEKMDHKVYIRFLRRLINHDGRKVFLIVDRHPVHRSRRVMKWLKEHDDQIEMFFLPGYSPNLNPPEYVNNDLKNQSGVREARIKDKPSLMSSVRRYLRKLQRNAEKVARFFLAPDIQYAGAS